MNIYHTEPRFDCEKFAPCAGSGSTLLAAAQLGRKAYGFEIKKKFFADANKFVLSRIQQSLFI